LLNSGSSSATVVTTCRWSFPQSFPTRPSLGPAREQLQRRRGWNFTQPAGNTRQRRAGGSRDSAQRFSAKGGEKLTVRRRSQRRAAPLGRRRGHGTVMPPSPTGKVPPNLVWLARHAVYGLATLHTRRSSFPRSVDNQFIRFTRQSPDIQGGFAAAQLLQVGTIRLGTWKPNCDRRIHEIEHTHCSPRRPLHGAAGCGRWDHRRSRPGPG
jgi:hypothetical protein